MADDTGQQAADGRVAGMDGMLDQVAEATMRRVRTELWPAFAADTAMQERIGVGIGKGAGQEIKPWVVIGATALVIVAGVAVYRVFAPEPAPTRPNPPKKTPARK
jgi:hypothetical protein